MQQAVQRFHTFLPPFDHYIIFFLQLPLSFQSSSINPFSPISPLIPSAQGALGLPRFLLPGGLHFITSFGSLPSSILSICPYHWSCLVLISSKRDLTTFVGWRGSNGNLHTVHTAHDAAPHNHSQHKQCRTPHAVARSLVLLMMGTIMPETCWDRSLIINIGLVASCWFPVFTLPSWCTVTRT